MKTHYLIFSAFLPFRRIKIIYSFAFFFITLTACSTTLDKPAYLTYLTDPKHGLTQTQEVNGAFITCSYRPPDLLINQELATRPDASPDSLRRLYANKTYCALTLSQNGAEIEGPLINDSNAYAQALAYLNTGIAQDVVIAPAGTSTDSTVALAASYTRQYGTTGRSTVLLVFDTHALNLSHGFGLTFHGDKFNLGTLRFLFTAHDLHKIPNLRY